MKAETGRIRGEGPRQSVGRVRTAAAPGTLVWKTRRFALRLLPSCALLRLSAGQIRAQLLGLSIKAGLFAVGEFAAFRHAPEMPLHGGEVKRRTFALAHPPTLWHKRARLGRERRILDIPSAIQEAAVAQG